MIGEGNMKPKIVTVLSLAMLTAPALADTVILDPLHGYCGGVGQCADNFHFA
jgi:hypothetical protein